MWFLVIHLLSQISHTVFEHAEIKILRRLRKVLRVYEHKLNQMIRYFKLKLKRILIRPNLTMGHIQYQCVAIQGPQQYQTNAEFLGLRRPSQNCNDCY